MAKTLATRFLPALAACLLGCTALSGGARAGWFDSGPGKTDAAAKSDPAKPDAAKPAPAGDLEGSIRQAQMLRLSGNYPEAVRHLSQLMLVAADDGRVITEYGKTLAAEGRAQEAVNFLTRAQQLQGNDWSVYNALGVAYDELDKQDEARAAYEHALGLRPGEASVLNNYALSRLLAKDPAGARALTVRAQNAGGAADPKIARNIALIDSLAADTAAAAAPPAPRAVAMAAPAPAPRTPVSTAPMAAPRALQPAPPGGVIQAQPQVMAQVQPSGVVMQRVPDDPQAGPVISATRAPRALAPRPAKVAAKTNPAPAAAAEDLQAKAEAIARTLNGKPAAIAQAKAEAQKPAPAAPNPAPRTFAKAQAPHAEAKAVPVKAVAGKDAIPALRLSANAY